MPSVGGTHHIELGGHYYMLRPGTYRKAAAPMFGARFTSGDPDFNNLSGWQHWAQRCFIGGADQDLWQDDAMYDEGIGLDTTDHEKVRVSRGLVRGTGSNWSISSSTTRATNGYKAVVYNSLLYVLTLADVNVESQLWRYDAGTDGWTRITSLDTKNMVARSITVFDSKLFIGGQDSVTNLPKVVYDDGALTSWTVLTNPAGVGTGTVRSMKGFQQKLYVAYGTKVWRFKGDETQDGTTVFYTANASSGSNYIVSMEVHIGFLYMLSQNGHVHRTDGNTTFDMWQWDGQTQGQAIKSFDGRLFILTFEYTSTTDVGYGVLYQMSGSAMTQLKRWGDDTQATRIGNMVVYDRRLFYGASNNLGFGSGKAGFGVACYDPVEDAHSIIANNGDTVTFTRGALPYSNYIVDDQIFFGGFLFAFVRGHGAFKTPYKPNDFRLGNRGYDLTFAGASVAGLNGGYLTTSTYDAGMPGVKKLWRKITVDATTPATCSVFMEYSIDNGATYVTVGSVVAQGARAKFDFFLNNIVATSLKLRITLRTTTSSQTPTLWGYIVSYLPQPEPNWQWTFTIVLASKMQLLDDTNQTVDTEAELTFLGAAWRAKLLLHFTDAEGVLWATAGQPGVLITDMTVSLRDLTQPLEGEVTITLLEAVETY